MTEYVVLIIGDADRWWTTMTFQERQDGYAEYERFGEELEQARPPGDRRGRAARATRGPVDPGRGRRRHRRPVHGDHRAGRWLLPGRDRRPRRPPRVLPDHRGARATGSRCGRWWSPSHARRATGEAVRGPGGLRAGGLGRRLRGGPAGVLRRPPRLRGVRRVARPAAGLGCPGGRGHRDHRPAHRRGRHGHGRAVRRDRRARRRLLRRGAARPRLGHRGRPSCSRRRTPWRSVRPCPSRGTSTRDRGGGRAGDGGARGVGTADVLAPRAVPAARPGRGRAGRRRRGRGPALARGRRTRQPAPPGSSRPPGAAWSTGYGPSRWRSARCRCW